TGSTGATGTTGAQGVTGATGSAGNAWQLDGNAGTVDGTNFIGTIDDIPINFRVNNENAGRVESPIGTGARRGNTALGYHALHNNMAGGNTAIGYGALLNNTGGTSNTAVGQYALNTTTSIADNNIGI